MIVLDTNVLSELMRASPERRALAWVNAQPASQLSWDERATRRPLSATAPMKCDGIGP